MWFRRWLLLLLLLTSMITRGADVSEPLKVMSWNLHHGAGLDGKLDLARIAAFIKKQDADVVEFIHRE